MTVEIPSQVIQCGIVLTVAITVILLLLCQRRLIQQAYEKSPKARRAERRRKDLDRVLASAAIAREHLEELAAKEEQKERNRLKKNAQMEVEEERNKLKKIIPEPWLPIYDECKAAGSKTERKIWLKTWLNRGNTTSLPKLKMKTIKEFALMVVHDEGKSWIDEDGCTAIVKQMADQFLKLPGDEPDSERQRENPSDSLRSKPLGTAWNSSPKWWKCSSCSHATLKVPPKHDEFENSSYGHPDVLWWCCQKCGQYALQVPQGSPPEGRWFEENHDN